MDLFHVLIPEYHITSLSVLFFTMKKEKLIKSTYC